MKATVLRKYTRPVPNEVDLEYVFDVRLAGRESTIVVSGHMWQSTDTGQRVELHGRAVEEAAEAWLEAEEGFRKPNGGIR